jgi:hypothetical protein
MSSILKSKILGWLVAIFAIVIGFYPAIYFIIDRRFGLLSSKSETLLANTLWNIVFYGHITFGGLALMIGWLQFSQSLRKNKLQVHRRIGSIYLLSVLISGVCGVGIGFAATGGIIASIGFISLGLIWLITTFLGFSAVKKGNIHQHEKFLIYSYAACFSAVTLRIWLPILIAIFGAFDPAFRIVAWLCWVPNLVFAYSITNNLKKLV